MNSPFKFLDSYTKDDKEVFFGRDAEIEELYKKSFDSKILIVYGISGTGKSSLINCGLANKFNDADWLPVYVRRSENIISSLSRSIEKNSISEISKEALHEKSILNTIKSLYLDHFKPLFLIFDQFEELFIFGTQQEKEQFAGIVKKITESDLQCRFIFVIREEYLASLTELEKNIPTFLGNRLRIEKMTRQNAKKAVEGPCKAYGIIQEEGFADALLDKLSTDSSEIELTYLQVILDKIFRLAQESEEQKGIFTHALLSGIRNVQDLLGSFLDEQIAVLNDADALSLLKTFVSIKGTRQQITVQEVIEHARTMGVILDSGKVQQLILRFIALRILNDQDENHRYELRHDALAAKIYEKITFAEKEILEVRQFIEISYDNHAKRNILLSDQDLKYIAHWEGKLFLPEHLTEFIEKSKTSLKRRARLSMRASMIGMLIFLSIGCGIVYFAFTKSSKVETTDDAQRAIFMKNDFPDLAFLTALEIYKQDTNSFPAVRAIFETFYELYSLESYTDSIGAQYFPEKSFVEFNACDTNIKEIIVSNDEKYIIGLMADNSMKLWDIRGCILQESPALPSEIIAFKISPENQFIACLTKDSTLHLFDSSFTVLLKTPLPCPTYNASLAFEFSGNGNYLAYINTGSLNIISLSGLLNNKGTQTEADDILLQKIKAPTIKGLDFSPDGKYLVYWGDKDPVIYYLNQNNNYELYHTYNDFTYYEIGDSLAFSTFVNSRDSIRTCQFSPNGKYIITACENLIFIWSLDKKIPYVYYTNIYYMDNNCFKIQDCISAEFTNTPNAIILTYLKKDSAGRLSYLKNSKVNFPRGYEADTYHNFMFDADHLKPITCYEITFSDDSRYAAQTLFSPGKLFLINVKNGKPVLSLKGHNPVFIDNGKYLLYISGKELKCIPSNEDEIIHLLMVKKIWGTLKRTIGIQDKFYSL